MLAICIPKISALTKFCRVEYIFSQLSRLLFHAMISRKMHQKVFHFFFHFLSKMWFLSNYNSFLLPNDSDLVCEIEDEERNCLNGIGLLIEAIVHTKIHGESFNYLCIHIWICLNIIFRTISNFILWKMIFSLYSFVLSPYFADCLFVCMYVYLFSLGPFWWLFLVFRIDDDIEILYAYKHIYEINWWRIKTHQYLMREKKRLIDLYVYGMKLLLFSIYTVQCMANYSRYFVTE